VVIWVAAILVVAAVALFVAAPLSDDASDGGRPATGGESERHEHEHALAVQALRELEFDHAMGKLDADDYRALRQRLEIRALAGMSVRASSPDRIAPAVAPSQSIAPDGRCHREFLLPMRH
jgi:cytochrome c-type biogenesis protein CcmI